MALATGMSRRTADTAVANNRVAVNGKIPDIGYNVKDSDTVTLDNSVITTPVNSITIMLNKPVGYVVSRDGQGSKTVYDLLPEDYHRLKPVGRLDKDSSGLLLLTNDGSLANELTHPSKSKQKVYEITLKTPLQPLHRQMISDFGIELGDGPSRFELEHRTDDDRDWTVSMSEGRNRQIRRTFDALGYEVIKLHRTDFGPYSLNELESSKFEEV